MAATLQVAQTTLRVGARPAQLDELLAEREKINEILQETIDARPSRGASRSRWSR